ncbi:hypothetical protein K491DRAFT_710538 [Lophiostoma macrostomum CBS 122681]|uniref:Ig-like domain-containing protein n=1 Tax=Lophiostoma macrostomum CBS 122681 TaxID=1314788 RepID=A0A6A6TRB3_9PLEO|nr:hypothetical protein K491DRAFT_710538 [Lophiostoma macrostomum CBS 122681]
MHLRYQVLFVALLTSIVTAAGIPSSTDALTECKACPYSLCRNKPWNANNITLTCWTAGTKIVDDTTWLKTEDNCYVTQYDLKEYDGDYTVDLLYCGAISSDWTSLHAKTKYMSECFNTPYVLRKRVKAYKNEVDLTLTCVTRNTTVTDDDDRFEIMGSAKWYKTSSNCYVHEATLYHVEYEDELEDCGPTPGVDYYAHQPDPVTSSSLAPTATATPGLNATIFGTLDKRSDLTRRWIYNTTIGEEYANCTEKATINNSTENAVEQVFEFGQSIDVQCGTVEYGEGRDNYTIFLLTTDFCWVQDWMTDPNLIEAPLRQQAYPHCEVFTDTES